MFWVHHSASRWRRAEASVPARSIRQIQHDTALSPAGAARQDAPSLSIWPEIAWLLPLLLIPLWVNLWSFQPFEHAKSLLLSGLMWLSVAYLAARHVWRGPQEMSSTAGRHVGLPLPVGPLHVAALIWLAVLGVATLWAVDPALSFFGGHLRGQGFLTQLSYVLLFFLVGWGLSSQEQIDRLYSVVAVGTTPLLALGALQAAGLDPLGLVSDARASVYTTLGRANFTGAYLALALPLTLNRILAAEHRVTRGLWGALLAGQIVLIGLSGARSGWLASATGMAALTLLLVWPTLAYRGRQRLGLGVASGAGLLVILAFRLMTTATEGSIAARVTIWRATLDLVAARPWTGYGLENLAISFPWVYPPQLVYYQGRDVFVDRAHNLFLDWAVAAGVPGLLALLGVLGACFYVGLSRWRVAGETRVRGTRLHLATALAVAAAGLAGNLAAFDVTATAALTWAAMGVIVARPLGSYGESAPFQMALPSLSVRHAPGLQVSIVRGLAALLILGGVLLAIAQGIVRPVFAGIVHQAAIDAARTGDWPAATQQAEQAVRLWPHDEAHWLLAGQVAEHAARHLAGEAQWARLAAAEAAYRTVVERRPLDAAGWAALGGFYAAWPAHVDLATARAAYDRAFALAPNLAVLWFEVAQLHLAHGDTDGALHALYATVDLDATHAAAHRLMGDLYGHHYNDWEAAQRAYAAAEHWEQTLRE